MKSGRRKYKLTTYILSCMWGKKKKIVLSFFVVFFLKEMKMFSNIDLKWKKQKQTNSVTCFVFCPFFCPMSAVIEEQQLIAPAYKSQFCPFFTFLIFFCRTAVDLYKKKKREKGKKKCNLLQFKQTISSDCNVSLINTVQKVIAIIKHFFFFDCDSHFLVFQKLHPPVKRGISYRFL